MPQALLDLFRRAVFGRRRVGSRILPPAVTTAHLLARVASRPSPVFDLFFAPAPVQRDMSVGAVQEGGLEEQGAVPIVRGGPAHARRVAFG